MDALIEDPLFIFLAICLLVLSFHVVLRTIKRIDEKRKEEREDIKYLQYSEIYFTIDRLKANIDLSLSSGGMISDETVMMIHDYNEMAKIANKNGMFDINPYPIINVCRYIENQKNH